MIWLIGNGFVGGSYIKGLSNEEWQILDNKIRKEEDVSSYRPQGNWRIENVEVNA